MKEISLSVNTLTGRVDLMREREGEAIRSYCSLPAISENEVCCNVYVPMGCCDSGK